MSLEQGQAQVWNYVTVWTVAKQVLRAGWLAARLSHLKWSNNREDSTIMPLTPLDDIEGEDVWPVVFKPAPKAREHELDFGEKRGKKKRTCGGGGVKLVSPGTLLGVPAATDGAEPGGESDAWTEAILGSQTML